MATHVVRKDSIHRTGVVLNTTTKLYFYRMWYRISYFQNYYSLPNPIPLHDIISIRKALKLCTSTQTPNHLVWILFWTNILPPSSDSLLKTQTMYSYETLLPRPHVILTKTIEQWWDVDIENLAENCLWNWKYYHSHRNIYSPY
jgi:hypothetical protein